MSSHADTIRRLLTEDSAGFGFAVQDDALAALDALLAENQRLREALERIATHRVVSGDSPDAANLLDYAGIAREALAGDAE